MKKFLEDLKNALKKNRVSDQETEEIIKDHEDMIQEALDDGLSEDDIPNKFGDPEVLAKELAQSANKRKVEEDDEEKEKTESGLLFSAKDIKGFDINLISEDLSIDVYDGDAFEVHGENINMKQYHIEDKDHVLHLARKQSFTIKFRIFREKSGHFILKVPKDHALGQVVVNTKSSDVKIEHIDMEDIHIKTLSGDYHLDHLNAKKFYMKSVSGDAKVDHCQFQHAEMSNVSGDFKLTNTKIEELFTLSAVSGDLDIEKVTCKELIYSSVSGDLNAKEFYPDEVTLKSISGDIKFKNENKDHTINIKKKRSISGDIEM